MGAYADAGVDYTKMEPFKEALVRAARETLVFPQARGVYVDEGLIHAHGAVFKFKKPWPKRWWSVLHWLRFLFGKGPVWCKTQEGLGNLNWIAEWLYQIGGTGRTYYDVIARAAALLIAIDVISQGAMPVIWTDEVAAGDSDWFTDRKRSEDYARGCVSICRELKMALPAGESPSLRYLVKSEPPVKSCPTLSGSITGVIYPRSRLITGKKLAVHDSIIGVPSSGLHSNGTSLVLKEALKLPERLLTKLSTGRTLGEEALIPVRSYVALVEALLEADVEIHALLPGTGDGVGKVAFDHRDFTYRIHTWVEVPPLFQFMRELGVKLHDCLKTFNWGIGYYLFVPAHEVERTIRIGKKAGYDLVEVGRVEEGERKVIFEPEGITLPPPGQ